MSKDKTDRQPRDFRALFDTIAFPEAYRITYLAGSIANRGYAAIQRDLGIIRAEFVLLACLAHFPEMTAQEVARVSQRPRNTVSRAVHRMVAEGYIERAPDASDGRQARLRITPAGRDLQDRASKYLRSRQDEVLACLEADERAQLSALLRKVARGAALLGD